MRAIMCLSHFQLPRCQVHTFSGSWWKKVHNFNKKVENSSNLRFLSPNIYCDLQASNSRRWTRNSLSTNTQGKNIASRKTNNIVTNLTPTDLNTSRIEISECKSVDIEQMVAVENKNVTVICFDTETTGFSTEYDRILEIALRDLSGGENSTFQTLINPEKHVRNSNIHKIFGYMVTSPGVPRMKDLIPILLRWIESRRTAGGQILLIGHNCRSFDVRFLKHEFHRCGYQLPKDWRFLDTMPLANILKAEGSISKVSLAALREYYNIKLVGQAHRAMADVDVLALVFQKMTFDLKLTVSNLVQNHTFTAYDSEKKKVEEKK